MKLLRSFLYTILLIATCAGCNSTRNAQIDTTVFTVVPSIEETNTPVHATSQPTLLATANPSPTFVADISDKPVTKTPSEPIPTPFERDINLVPQVNIPFGIENSIAFYIDMQKLVVSDISDLTSPKLLWSSTTLGNRAKGITVSSGKAYLQVESDLHIWDVSNPADPRQINIIPIGNPQEIFISPQDNIIYLLESEGEKYRNIRTLDISQPDSSYELGKAALDLTIPSAWVISKGHLYSLYDDYFEIIDLSNPAMVTSLAHQPLPKVNWCKIQVVDNLVYIGPFSGVWVFDVSNPANPRELGELSRDWIVQFYHMNIVGTRGYFTVSICDAGVDEEGQPASGCGTIVAVYDLEQPTWPKRLGYARIHPLKNTEDVIKTHIMGNYAFFQTYDSWYALDLADLDP